jgi:asparaginyl-tRNA synthetase
VLEQCPHDLDFLKNNVDQECLQRIELMVKSDFETLDYRDAIQILQQSSHPFQYPVEFGLDLQSEHERYLTDIHFKKPVIIKNYPENIKSFYMKLNDDQTTVAAMDVLAPGIGEIIGGSAREDRLDILDARMKKVGINPETYEWYRDLRRYGSVPHAGFGLGLERLLSYITGINNVRDLIPFPRTPGSINF